MQEMSRNAIKKSAISCHLGSFQVHKCAMINIYNDRLHVWNQCETCHSCTFVVCFHASTCTNWLVLTILWNIGTTLYLLYRTPMHDLSSCHKGERQFLIMLHYNNSSWKWSVWLINLSECGFKSCPVKNLTNMTFVCMQILKSVVAAIKLLTSSVLPFVPYTAQVWL